MSIMEELRQEEAFKATLARLAKAKKDGKKKAMEEEAERIEREEA